jgi:hypothetical protein
MAFIIGFVICALVGALIGQCKGRPGSGVVWGGLLGPIGWLIVALLTDLRPQCGECGGIIVEGARKCMHCGSVIERMIDVRCPICGEQGKIKEARVNGEVTCPACRRVFSAANARVY